MSSGKELLHIPKLNVDTIFQLDSVNDCLDCNANSVDPFFSFIMYVVK